MKKPFKIIKNMDSVIMDKKHMMAICRFDAFDRRTIMENYAPVELNVDLVQRAINTITSFFETDRWNPLYITMLVPKDSTDQVLFIVRDYASLKRKGGIPKSDDFVITIAPRLPDQHRKQSLLEKDDVRQWV